MDIEFDYMVSVDRKYDITYYSFNPYFASISIDFNWFARVLQLEVKLSTICLRNRGLFINYQVIKSVYWRAKWIYNDGNVINDVLLIISNCWWKTFVALGERNFHVFYQLLNGASDEKLKSLKLQRNPQNYYYTKQVPWKSMA